MSKFLEFPDIALTPTYLHKIALFYMLEEECTAQEFVENLKIYENFTGSHVFFDSVINEPFQTTPIIYRSLKNEEYICKSDLYVVLQNMAYECNLSHYFAAFSIFAFFLKTEEEKVNGKMEFVRFDQNMLEVLRKQLRQEIDKITQKEKEKAEVSKLNFEEHFQKMKSIVPNVWNEQREARLRSILGPLFQQQPPEVQSIFMSLIYSGGSCIVNALEKVIKRRPELFSPRPYGPPTVRIFEDGEQKFVMRAEFCDVVGLDLTDPLNTKEEDRHIFLTMDMKEAIDMIGTDFIAFIRYPIRRAKHKAVPIKGAGFSGDGDFFVLAVDAFFELFKSLVHGLKLFQNQTFDRFLLTLEQFEGFFSHEINEPYFLKIHTIHLMNCVMEEITENDKKVEKKDVRNAKKDGFTVQNLKNELKHLGLTETFPEIQEHAEVVYKHVDNVKKENFLRTCDLFDAVEYCQMICVLQRLPNYMKFLHNQKGCERIPGLRCEDCEGIQKKTSVDTGSSVKNQKNLNIEGPVDCEKKEETQKIQSSDIPKTCKKCQESSAILIETQKALKMSQDQLKEMEKKHENIVESEAKTAKKVSDLKTKLNNERKKNQKSKEDFQLLTEENKDHLETVIALRAENKKLDKMNQKLQNKLTKQSPQTINYQSLSEVYYKSIEEIEKKHEEEILKKSTEIEELQKTILKWTAEKEAIESLTQQLLDRITNLTISNQKTDQIVEKTIVPNSDSNAITCPVCSMHVYIYDTEMKCSCA